MSSDTFNTTVYFVGKDAADARNSMEFDSPYSALSYLEDQTNSAQLHIFSAQAIVDLSTLTAEPFPSDF